MYSYSSYKHTKQSLNLTTLVNVCNTLTIGTEVSIGEFKVILNEDGYTLKRKDITICSNYKIVTPLVLILYNILSGHNEDDSINTHVFQMYYKYEKKLFEYEDNLTKIDKYHREGDIERMTIEHCKMTENKSRKNTYHKFIIDMVTK